MIYTIKLSDGTILENLDINGNTFISSSPISKDVFDHNLSPVTIMSDEDAVGSLVSTGVHTNMDLVFFDHEDGSNEWKFALVDLSEEDVRFLKNRSDIEYIALMMDIEL